jgi:glycerol uptake facilitator-like aquaporin
VQNSFVRIIYIIIFLNSKISNHQYFDFQIAFTFGLMIAVCIQMIGHVSGGHMNPAVSIAMAVANWISPTRAFLYVCAQSAGGILGSFLLKL